MLDSRVLAGIKAFNQGEYYTAHELWESVWREAVPPEKGYYQGLIQAAMALHHLNRGNAVGASRLAGRALDYLKEFRSSYLGLDISQLKQFLRSLAKDNLLDPASHAVSFRQTADEYQAYPCLILCVNGIENVEGDTNDS